MFMNGVGLFPIQILQGPNVIVIQHEAVTQPRRIYMDGRAHPAPDDLLLRSSATRSAAGRATRSWSIRSAPTGEPGPSTATFLER